MRTSLRLGACQTPELLGDVSAALDEVEAFAARADIADLDLLLFPECFLQGYLVDPEHLSRYALDLDSAEFGEILARLAPIRQTLVLGVIEQRGGRFFNSAAVIANGVLLGAYRKTHLREAESVFTAGDDYPVFARNGVRFGINICYDTGFPRAAANVARQGAQVLLVPAQNMMRQANAVKWKDLHNAVRAERARESGMWLVSADVTGRRDELRVGYGPTAVINPAGQVVAQVPLDTTGLVVTEIRVR